MRSKLYLFITVLSAYSCKHANDPQKKTNLKSINSSSRMIKYHGLTTDTDGQVLIAANMPDYSKFNTLNQKNTDGIALSDGKPADALTPVNQSKTPYMKTCEAQGVPLPPAWGDEGWKLIGTLDETKLFADTGRTQLWTFSTTAGTCAALPRFRGENIYLLGVICASKEGKTCFFDNSDSNGDPVAVPKGYRLSDGRGADQLSENCTRCHRGDNPWVIVPGQPLEKLPTEYKYFPIGGKEWTNPPGDKTVAPGCNSCHSLPKLSEEYCDIALDMIGKKVMPPDGETSGIKEFKVACDKL